MYATRSLSLVAATVVLAASATAVGHAAPSPDALLRRYQPVTVLHPAELFRPVAVDSFLQTAQVEQRLPDGTWIPSVGTTPGLLPTTDPAGCTSTAALACWRLNVPTCTPAGGIAALSCYRDLERSHVEPNVVYGAVVPAGTTTFLEYWYWYWYDFWSGTFPATDYVWQAHEGDWEVVTVELSAAGVPLSVGYSRHSCGRGRSGPKTPKS